jgi:formamidopyrimidine-DNA glycosylase
MPELPDILLYLHALRPRVVGHRVIRTRLAPPFLLRSIDPPLMAVEGRVILDVHRLGKRVVFEAERDLFLVFHLMIAGRFRWKPAGTKIPGKLGQLALDFEHGTLLLTEAGTKRQASLHVVEGRETLARHNPGGLEVMDASLDAFREALRTENHTLKRALTDPHLFSGIGNAYSDEILHAARLSPFKQTHTLSAEETARLYESTRATLAQWTARLQQEVGDDFPEKVTAFRPEMAVHGRYRQPCPDCGSPVRHLPDGRTPARRSIAVETAARGLAADARGPRAPPEEYVGSGLSRTPIASPRSRTARAGSFDVLPAFAPSTIQRR